MMVISGDCMGCAVQLIVRRMRHILSVTFLALWICAGCGVGSGAPLHFVLPDGFKGAIQIVGDPNQGLAVREEAGRFTYVIPPDGKLRVQSLEPFTQWHKESAAFQSGGVLQTDDNGPEDSVAWRGLGALDSNGVTTIRYCVGTKKDEDDLR